MLHKMRKGKTYSSQSTREGDVAYALLRTFIAAVEKILRIEKREGNNDDDDDVRHRPRRRTGEARGEAHSVETHPRVDGAVCATPWHGVRLFRIKLVRSVETKQSRVAWVDCFPPWCLISSIWPATLIIAASGVARITHPFFAS